MMSGVILPMPVAPYRRGGTVHVMGDLAAGFHVTADHPSCYDIQGGVNAVWGNYFYYGGPGRNVRCT